MIKKLATLLVITLITACSNSTLTGLDETSITNNHISTFSDSKSFETYFNDVIKQNKSVGLSVAVIRGDKVEFHNYGYISKSKKIAPTENSIFHVASISKAFTGVLLGELVSKGNVSLQDSLESLLPKGVVVPKFSNEPITLELLATHIAGLPTSPNDLEKINYDNQNPYANYNTKNVYDYLKNYQLIQDNEKKIGFGYYSYSNLGFGLLGHSLGLKDKSNYNDALKKRILNPLGLRNTSVALNKVDNASMVTGHYYYNNELYEQPMSNFTEVLAGGAALKSTSKDLAKFVQANMGVIETPLRKGMDLSHKEIFTGQSLGWLVNKTINNKEIIWHNGAWFASGFCGFIGFDKVNKNGLVILSNQINYYEEIAPAGIKIIMDM